MLDHNTATTPKRPAKNPPTAFAPAAGVAAAFCDALLEVVAKDVGWVVTTVPVMVFSVAVRLPVVLITVALLSEVIGGDVMIMEAEVVAVPEAAVVDVMVRIPALKLEHTARPALSVICQSFPIISISWP
jgi:hypothetical protein